MNFKYNIIFVLAGIAAVGAQGLRHFAPLQKESNPVNDRSAHTVAVSSGSAPVVPAPNAYVATTRNVAKPIVDNAQRAAEEAAAEEIFQRQAESAKYSFSSVVQDGINDNEQIREEVRDGLTLKGLYSYSDGYYKRTVHYEADGNGYRVVKEEVEAIGDGPRFDPHGHAEVSSSVGGTYTITADDIQDV